MTERTARGVATRQRFVDEALRLFREQGYEQTSMAQIAAAAGGSRSNLYLYFSGKPQIVLARMHELEDDVADLYRALDELPSHDEPAMRRWLESAREMWRRYSPEFEAIAQVMTAEQDVLDEWLGLIRRMCAAQTVLYESCASEDEREDRAVHMSTLMMSLERTFYFLYVRGHDDHEDRVLASLARQWAYLFSERPGPRP
ncbi:TetR/AcrR family transcriptional regulator [Georgenia sp. AZ-5]|uniref:TetR/AcrR family transcriptional regulator n=1 Tax=Georgenia sp. AZ-5 TaxID=3367526 RepID=UPI00375412EA